MSCALAFALFDKYCMAQGKAIAHLEGKNVVEPSPYTCAAWQCLACQAC